MNILVADDSQTNLTLLSLSLQKLGHEVIAAENGQRAIELFQVSPPDLIILDVMMEGIDGFECAKKIRSMEQHWIPIIFLSGSIDDESIAKGIDAGGDDYLTKPYSKVTLAAKIKAMQRISNMRQELFEATEKLSKLSATDTLTGLNNRLQFNKVIKERIEKAQKEEGSFALLFLDLDQFKAINDGFGHHMGDLFLIEMGRRLQACIGEEDFLARMGGDEFALILKQRNQEDLSHSAQKMIEAIAAPCTLEGAEVSSSASIGIVLYPEHGTDQDTLIKNADKAMYEAKSSGGNRFLYFHAQNNQEQTPRKLKATENKPLTQLRSNEPKKRIPALDLGQKLSVLNCLVNQSRLCIDLRWIKKTLPLARVQRVPGSPASYLGFMNVSGKKLPIIDLGVSLNLMRETAYNLSTPILLCSNQTHEAGFIVDKILGLYEVGAESIQIQDGIDSDSLFLATLNIEQELSLLVNIEALLAAQLNKKHN